MKFDIVTIFPDIFGSYFSESIIGRAQKNKLIEVKIHNLRDFSDDERKTVDDTPYGGGAGMVLKIEPIFKAVQSVLNVKNVQVEKSKKTITTNKTDRTRVILFSAKGKRLTQADVARLSQYENLVMICGRYEGVDERVVENLVDEEISIGDYVLTGGEIPAMILVDAVSRLLPGVLGNAESTKEESHSEEGVLEFPQYTKPEEFNGWKVPEILLSGDHQKIKEWRNKNSKFKITSSK